MALFIPRTVSPGGIPELVASAKALGDFSSARRFMGPGGEAAVVKRLQSRVIGGIGGRVTGAFKAGFGLWGMVLMAEFMTVLRSYIEYKASKPAWAGNEAAYAQAVNFGYVDKNGTAHAARPFFSKAIEDAVENKYGNKALRHLFQPPRFFDARGNQRFRSGLYESGRFVSDLGAFVRGDIVGRAVRRETGRVAAGFFWQTLRNPYKQIMGELAMETVRAARRNCRSMGLFDTGILWAANAAGSHELELIRNSVKQATEQGLSVGLSQKQVWAKLDMTAGGASTLTGPSNSDLYKMPMSTFPAS